MAVFESVDEALRKARRRVPPSVFERIDTGFRTQHENTRIFNDVFFHPRAARVYLERDLRTSALGAEISFPVILASPGASRLIHPRGELAAAAAAGNAGTINVVAMATGHSVEEVATAATGPLWQQLYLSRGREGAEELIERAANAGYQALVVTVDMPISPFRVVQGVEVRGPDLSWYNAIRYGPEAVLRPRWLVPFVRDAVRQRRLSAVERKPVVPGAGPARLRTGSLSNKLSATWDDFSWIREQWAGPIVVKGVLSADDARRAIDVGATGVVVSNHGGTMLDVSPTLRLLPQIVAAVGHSCEVYLDGGVREGGHVVRALALGARAVWIGRAYLMGLAAAGEAGILRVLEILRDEIDMTLGYLGCPSVHALDPSFVECPRDWPS